MNNYYEYSGKTIRPIALKYARVSFPVARQSFQHDVDASAIRSGRKLAQLEPTWLAYSLGPIGACGLNPGVNAIDLQYINLSVKHLQ